uniref:Uncharacterized protein n=1 Tax=Oryza rufipogon TaxID=4529 RepID=A0A0E0P5Y4_ORYRU
MPAWRRRRPGSTTRTRRRWGGWSALPAAADEADVVPLAAHPAPVQERRDDAAVRQHARQARFDQFKTFSGRLERQFSTLCGRPAQEHMTNGEGALLWQNPHTRDHLDKHKK